jgi:hypothetical protein
MTVENVRSRRRPQLSSQEQREIFSEVRQDVAPELPGAQDDGVSEVSNELAVERTLPPGGRRPGRSGRSPGLGWSCWS